MARQDVPAHLADLEPVSRGGLVHGSRGVAAMSDFPCCDAPQGAVSLYRGALVIVRSELPTASNWVVLAINPDTDQVLICPEQSEDGHAWRLVHRNEIL